MMRHALAAACVLAGLAAAPVWAMELTPSNLMPGGPVTDILMAETLYSLRAPAYHMMQVQDDGPSEDEEREQLLFEEFRYDLEPPSRELLPTGPETIEFPQ